MLENVENAVESKGGLAFKVQFNETPVESEKVKVLQDRANKDRRNSNADIKRKILEADIRRQKQQLETIVKLKETHDKVKKAPELKEQTEEQKRIELKKAQEEALERAEKQRLAIIEAKVQKAKAKDAKVKAKCVLEGRQKHAEELKQAQDEALERAEKQRLANIEEKVQKAKAEDAKVKGVLDGRQKHAEELKQAQEEDLERAEKQRMALLNEKIQKAKVKDVQSPCPDRLEIKQAHEAAMDSHQKRREEHLTNLKLRANKMARAVKRSNSTENHEDGSPAKKAC